MNGSLHAMRRAGRKYRALWRACLTESLSFRMQNFSWVFVGALPTVFAIVAWLAVYGDRSQRGNVYAQRHHHLLPGGRYSWYIIGGRINGMIARERSKTGHWRSICSNPMSR